MGSSGSGAAVLITVEVEELAPSVAVMVALPGVPAKTWTAVLPVLAGIVTVPAMTALALLLARVMTLSVERVGVMVKVMAPTSPSCRDSEVKARVIVSSGCDCGV